MNLKNKPFFVVLIICLILLLGATVCFADYAPEELENRIQTGRKTSRIKKFGGMSVGVIQLVGIFLSVIGLIVLGIKYLIGSTEERAEYKKTLLPYLIGIMLIFATTNVAQIIYNWIGGSIPK